MTVSTLPRSVPSYSIRPKTRRGPRKPGTPIRPEPLDSLACDMVLEGLFPASALVTTEERAETTRRAIARGYDQLQIAEMLGVSVKMVWNWIRRDLPTVDEPVEYRLWPNL